MTTTKKIRIGLKDVRDLAEGWTLWDTRISGFCARRRKSAAVFYALKYRTEEGRQRWHTIGRHGAPWTPDTLGTRRSAFFPRSFKERIPRHKAR